jgi:hypothetical protein
MLMQTNSAGKNIFLFFSRDKAWVLQEIDERRQLKGFSRTQVLEDLLVGQQSHDVNEVGKMR